MDHAFTPPCQDSSPSQKSTHSPISVNCGDGQANSEQNYSTDLHAERSKSFNLEHHLAGFFELSLDLFCIAGVDGYFLHLNANFAKVLGYSDEYLMSHPFLEFVHPDDVPSTLDAMRDLSAGKNVIRFRNRYRSCQNGFIWFEWSARMISEDGAIYAVARDITQQMSFEAEIIAQTCREQTLLDNTPIVVYVKDRDGRFSFVNRQFCEKFSTTLSKVMNRRPEDVMSSELAAQFNLHDQQVLVDADKITFQHSIRHNGEQRTFVSSRFPLFNAQRQVAAIVGMSTDITDQVQMQETETQLRLAKAFQRKLYPAMPPAMPHFDIAAAAVPVAQVCGDYYDLLPRGSDRLIVAMGDVSGHGIAPALEMVAVRTMMRVLLNEGKDLLRAVDELNRQLCIDLPECQFVSLFVAEIDSNNRSLRYIGAGHEGVLVRRSGEIIRLMSTGLLLGIDKQARVEDEVIDLESGDLFLVHTDGLSEAMNSRGEIFSSRRIDDIIRSTRENSAADIVQTVFSAVYEFASGRAIADDMTIVVTKFLQ